MAYHKSYCSSSTLLPSSCLLPSGRHYRSLHTNNQTQEQLLSLCHHASELLISGVIPTLAFHLHITYFIIPICILHSTFLPCKVPVLFLCIMCQKQGVTQRQKAVTDI
ncbi:hypothetical protein PFLUV_G00028630 [Perca fluviatilis]|uniref:Uncharacterized protein n=1 Tax=Perca fluviatilis TaxID=8168 RepID=A0A6A5FQ87_PERFL|nr:hypothetical protein PFLUV_G00028630 [Perca fluviatilis]